LGIGKPVVITSPLRVDSILQNSGFSRLIFSVIGITTTSSNSFSFVFEFEEATLEELLGKLEERSVDGIKILLLPKLLQDVIKINKAVSLIIFFIVIS
jgi:hypothetical protein